MRGAWLVLGLLVACDGAAPSPPAPDHAPPRPRAAPPPAARHVTPPDVIAPATTARASCDDPITGVWIAKTYAASDTRWHEHRLVLGRDADGALTARQTTRIWQGGPDDAFPRQCPQGGPDWGLIEMADQAEWLDGVLHVWGTRIVETRAPCGQAIPTYYLDSFTGRVRGNSFETTNNDGHAARDRPYRFHRVACAG
ncbi:MAG: hypothetical protein R3B06_16165 [Kofleriaceae bacterium]